MALKITCPHCGHPRRLHSPYPLPGTEVHCRSCGRVLSISYPPGMVDKLRSKGASFVESAPLSSGSEHFVAAPRPPDLAGKETAIYRRPDPTPPAPRARAISPAAEKTLPRPERPPAALPPPPPERSAPPPARKTTPPPPPLAPPIAPPSPAQEPPRRRRSLLGRLVRASVVLGLVGGLTGAGIAAYGWWHYSQDLPTVETLRRYTPPTVTFIHDREGRVLGEIYEKRRYVLSRERLFPLVSVSDTEEQACTETCLAREGIEVVGQCDCKVPRHVVDAFIASEDGNFWEHDGVDYEGIVRAVLRNASQGRKAQGASTITQQVARNFLLTSEKTYERKIREIILAGRIEDTFDKEHILYLYLNQIYLGSGAYGVEAAARTYFGKSAYQMTLAEAAILAGLPQRPSEYSPLQHWDKARGRQEYVLDQMLKKGLIDQGQHDSALAEAVDIVQGENEFLKQAPYFTEHIRRYLVDTYGFDKVYNDGLVVHATCDLELQKVAQDAVVSGVTLSDNLRGWRGPRSTLEGGRIEGWLSEQELALRAEVAQATLRVGPAGVGGYGATPEASALVEGRRYEAVTLSVEEKHAVVGVGRHRLIIPRSWTEWAYTVNPALSWGSRRQTDMTQVLKVGDVVDVEVMHLDAQEAENLKGYGPARGLAAARLYQAPTLQGALFSYRLSDGAVLAMVGGVDFENSEYNRAIQARRQVGSTFKPIVYAAAIQSRKFTAGTLVQDAPTVFRVLGGKLWKPGNYGEDYLGNITLRRALQMSRNVVTVRVLDKLGLDPVYDLAGPKLRIGYNDPVCSRTHIPASAECAGQRSPSRVEGMVWCESCDPLSCPLVEATNPTIVKNGERIPVGDPKVCMDEPVSDGGREWCHSCDVNLRTCDWLPIQEIPSTDPCADARKDEKGQIWCRTCDLSVGLGSSSLTMVELSRAYSAFATYGRLVEPHYIDRVLDRDGTEIESYQPPDQWPEVLSPGVAGITHWMLREVATGGTAAKSNSLGLHVAGKTGTTNDFIDAWFVGYNTELITASWVGFDTPEPIGQSFTGGKTALPIWMDYMRLAAPKDKDKDFPRITGVEMVPIDESSGLVATGGRVVPMLPGTAPRNVVGEVGQTSAEALLSEGF